MSKDASKKDTYFTEQMKHSVVEDFVVSYYNRKIKLDLGENDEEVFAQHSSFSGQDSVWTYRYNSNTYNYYVRRKEKFFFPDGFDKTAEVIQLCDKYSGQEEIPDGERPAVEKKLYSLIMLLMRLGRIEGDFKLQPARDSQMADLASQTERISKLLDALEKRVRSIENNPYLKTGIPK